jgi:hypothetical protein
MALKEAAGATASVPGRTGGKGAIDADCSDGRGASSSQTNMNVYPVM